MSATPRSMTALTMRRFSRHRMALAGAVVLGLLSLAAVAAPLVELALGVDATKVDLLARFAAPSADHPLGADALGRDVLVRLLYGGRVSLFVGLITAFAAASIGTTVGLAAGYYGGAADTVLMRVTDGVIALPLLPLLIILAAVDLTKIPVLAPIAASQDASLYRIIVIITLVGWTTVARLVRGAALSLREREYVLAARSQGAGGLRIMATHILPNCMAPIIVSGSVIMAYALIMEATLSFPGLGTQPPTPSWGFDLKMNLIYVELNPAATVFPGLAILVTVLGFNMLGDGLRDSLDPRLRQ